MYRSLQARGASVEEAARLIYLGTASFFDSVPTRWLMRWQGRRFFGRKRLDQLRHAAAISQERRYPDDWVFEFVEGDGQDFARRDYTECGVVKYLAREGAPELAPYLCWIDYPQFAAMHLRLDRTETIAQGGQRCDFRLESREAGAGRAGVPARLTRATRRGQGGRRGHDPSVRTPMPSDPTREGGVSSPATRGTQRSRDLRLLRPVLALWPHTQQSGRR